MAYFAPPQRRAPYFHDDRWGSHDVEDISPSPGGAQRYFGWAVAFSIGAIVANLIFSWFTGQYSGPATAMALNKPSQAIERQTEKVTAEPRVGQAQVRASNQPEQAQQQFQQRELRKEDAIGSRLRYSCAEWIQVFEQMKSAFALQEMMRSCQAFDNYVMRGLLPKLEQDASPWQRKSKYYSVLKPDSAG